jgi:O-antigen ligase
MLTMAILTDHKSTAFIGRYGRNSGWLEYLSYFILMIVASIHLKTQLAKRLILILIILGATTAVYGFLQFFNIDFISYVRTDLPIITTFGNSNFTSSFIGISIIATFIYVTWTKKQSVKILLNIIIFFELVLIMLSKSSQGIFVSLIGIIVYVLIKLYSKNSKFFWVGFLTFSCLLVLVILGFFKFGPLSTIVYQPSVTYRSDYYRAAIQMFLSNPWTGVGVDRFGENYRQFRDLEAAFRLGPSTTTNWAHNQFLQFFATGGFILGSIYLLLVISILVIGINNIKNLKDEKREIAIAIFVIWLGYQSQTLVSIDQISITMIGWILGGIILGLNSKEVAEIKKVTRQKRFLSFNNWSIFSFLLLIFLLIKSIPIWHADREIKLVASITSTNSKTSEFVKKLSLNVLNKAPSEVTYRLIAADKLATLGNYSLSEDILKDALRIDSKSYQANQYLARLYEVTGNFSKETTIREKLKSIDRYDVQNYSRLASNYLQENRTFEFNNLIKQMKVLGIDSKFIEQIILESNKK